MFQKLTKIEEKKCLKGHMPLGHSVMSKSLARSPIELIWTAKNIIIKKLKMKKKHDYK